MKIVDAYIWDREAFAFVGMYRRSSWNFKSLICASKACSLRSERVIVLRVLGLTFAFGSFGLAATSTWTFSRSSAQTTARQMAACFWAVSLRSLGGSSPGSQLTGRSSSRVQIPSSWLREKKRKKKALSSGVGPSNGIRSCQLRCSARHRCPRHARTSC